MGGRDGAGLEIRLLMARSEAPTFAGERLLDAQEVAEWLGIKEDYVREMGRRGEIPTVRIGKYIRYEPSAVRDCIGRHREAEAKKGR